MPLFLILYLVPLLLSVLLVEIQQQVRKGPISQSSGPIRCLRCWDIPYTLAVGLCLVFTYQVFLWNRLVGLLLLAVYFLDLLRRVNFIQIWQNSKKSLLSNPLFVTICELNLTQEIKSCTASGRSYHSKLISWWHCKLRTKSSLSKFQGCVREKLSCLLSNQFLPPYYHNLSQPQVRMMTSSSFGQKPLRQGENVSDLIESLVKKCQEGSKSSAHASGMGSMVVVRSKSGEATTTRLYEEFHKKGIVELWNSIKKIGTSRADAANLYFHLHGVLFLMIPHVPANAPGEVTISLCSSNDPANLVVSKKTLAFSSGPQAVLMCPDHCLPFIKDDIMFFYTTTVSQTTAQVPCSVLALWKQSIERKTACYEPKETASWFIKRLASPQMLKSELQAKRLIASAYGTEEAEGKMGTYVPAALQKLSHLDIADITDPDAKMKLQYSNGGILSLPSFKHYPGSSSSKLAEDPRRSFSGREKFPEVKESPSLVEDPRKSVSMERKQIPQGSSGVHRRRRAKRQLAARKNYLTDFELTESELTFGGKSKNKGALSDDQRKQTHESTDETLAFPPLPEAQASGFSSVLPLDEVWELFPLYYYSLREVPDHHLAAFQHLKLSVQHGLRRKPLYPVVPQVIADENVAENVLSTGVTERLNANTLEAVQGNFITDMKVLETLASSDQLFNFSNVVLEKDPVSLELRQPAVVSSGQEMLVDVINFDWNAADPPCKQALSVEIPAVLSDTKNPRSIGPDLSSFFDAALLEFKAYVTMPRTLGSNGELILIWDEGNTVGKYGTSINQATLIAARGVRISSYCMNDGMAQKQAIRFIPKGLGEFLPLDSGHAGFKVGSLRVYVLNPLRTTTSVSKYTCSLYITMKVLATNIMQPCRQAPQFMSGMPMGSASFPWIPINQLLLASQWDNTQIFGSGCMLTFSPASVFSANEVFQPSILCNLASNCHWWTGECVFGIKFNKTAFHSGRLAIAFGTLNSELKKHTDIYGMTHAVCDLNDGDDFECVVRITNWNGKNFLSAGRRSSLPRPDHKSLQRIFLMVVEQLQYTQANLSGVGVTLVLKGIRNCVLGGSVPLKPLFGHLDKSSSGTDFLYHDVDAMSPTLTASRMGLSLDEYKKLVEKTRKKKDDGSSSSGIVEPQLSVREKFSYFSTQYYIVPPEDSKFRTVVVPAAPWSIIFKDPKMQAINSSVISPSVAMSSGFVYWEGSLKYRIIVHRKYTEIVGGVLQVSLESTGFPKEPGIHEGTYPLATGGGQQWVFPCGVNRAIFEFQVEDDKFFARRYTNKVSLDKDASRLSTLSDRLGNLVLVLPPKDFYNMIEVQIAFGDDFSFSVSHPPVPAGVKTVGSLEVNTYSLLQESGKFKPLVDQTKVL
uniref:Polyprotein n=1 Tax=Lophophytum mirabile torradovirus TaxID=3115801 RepID=A0AAT9JAR3_9SECO